MRTNNNKRKRSKNNINKYNKLASKNQSSENNSDLEIIFDNQNINKSPKEVNINYF